MSTQYIFSAVMTIVAVGYYLALCKNIQWGHPWMATYCVQVISPFTLAAMALLFEKRSLADITNIGALPWSLTIGDPVFVALAAWTIAKAYKRYDILLTRRWLAVWICFGVAVCLLFNWSDGSAFVEAGRASALLSPTKTVHDFVTMPVLLAALFGTGLPALKRPGWYRWVLVGCFLAWWSLVVIDGQRDLDLTQLHPLWDAVNFRPVR